MSERRNRGEVNKAERKKELMEYLSQILNFVKVALPEVFESEEVMKIRLHLVKLVEDGITATHLRGTKGIDKIKIDHEKIKSELVDPFEVLLVTLGTLGHEVGHLVQTRMSDRRRGIIYHEEVLPKNFGLMDIHTEAEARNPLATKAFSRIEDQVIYFEGVVIRYFFNEGIMACTESQVVEKIKKMYSVETNKGERGQFGHPDTFHQRDLLLAGFANKNPVEETRLLFLG